MISHKAILDKSVNPKGLHVGDRAHIVAGAEILCHDAWRGLKKDTYIGVNSLIGSRSLIMPGVRIGDMSVVGACSVVTKDVPSNSTVVLGEVIVIAHKPTSDTHYYSKNSDGKWIVFNNGKFELSEVQFGE